MTEPAGSGPGPERGEPPPKSRWQKLRPFLVVVLFVGLLVLGKVTGLVDRLDTEEVRATVADAGPWGVLLYVAIFAAGELVHVPGMVFVAAGVLAWGRVAGFFVTLLASIVSVSVSFFVVRAVGGKALARIDKPFMRKLLDRLHARPILTIVILRAVFWLAPPLNYALALSSVRFRDYLVGSALGLVVPILLAVAVLDLLFQ
jgi:uncharacterized membrane protein YdjX (TVP38/TMEM64 family)